MATLVRDGVSLVYHDTGTGDPPLVLIHGWCCDHTYFAPQAEHFSQQHRVISVDLRGHGESDKPRQEYSIEGYADDVAWLCGELGIRNIVAVGHSMGGVIAFTLASQHPELVDSCVMVDAPVFLKDAIAENMPGFIEGLRSPAYLDVAGGFIDTMLFLPTSDALMHQNIRKAMLSAPQYVMVSSMTNIIRDRTELAMACTRPVLLIDAEITLNDEPRLRAAMPTIEIRQTPGFGHFNQLEAPDQVNSIIEQFLEQHAVV